MSFNFMDLFDTTASTTGTIVPQSTLDNLRFKARKQSYEYFTIPINAVARDRDPFVTQPTLAVQEEAKFSIKNNDHRQFVIDCTNNFQNNFDTLVAIDKKIIASVLL